MSAPRRKPIRDRALLKQRLDELAATFDIATIAPDPLQLALRYDDPRDREIAAIVAAAFAYGRADIIVANIGEVLQKMQPSPYAYVAELFSADEARQRFRGFTHRFHKTADLVAFLSCIATAVRRHGSLGALFKSVYRDDEEDIGPSLARFVEALIAGGRVKTCHPEAAGRPDPGPAPRPRPKDPLPTRDDRESAGDSSAAVAARRRVTSRGGLRMTGGRLPRENEKALRYLLTSPVDGSACKRMNLFLRWMVRRESPDLALWTFVDPAKLVIPLDTHVHRISTFLGLGTRKSADWKAARAITDVLATFDAADPVRYDFALCRLGILNRCSQRKKKENCDVCLLRDVCRFPVT